MAFYNMAMEYFSFNYNLIKDVSFPNPLPPHPSPSSPRLPLKQDPARVCEGQTSGRKWLRGARRFTEAALCRATCLFLSPLSTRCDFQCSVRIHQVSGRTKTQHMTAGARHSLASADLWWRCGHAGGWFVHRCVHVVHVSPVGKCQWLFFLTLFEDTFW